MEMFIDIAGIVFICVNANHLGLVKAIEDVFDVELPIVNCAKCFSCWCVFIYSVFAFHSFITSLAISFLASYCALWLELLECFIDRFYLRLYEKITTEHTDDAAATDAGNGNSEGSVSQL